MGIKQNEMDNYITWKYIPWKIKLLFIHLYQIKSEL